MEVRTRVENQYSTSYMTFLSILIGFAFEDIVSIIRADERFFVPDLMAINLWSQVIVCVTAAMTAWVAYGQVAMARRAVPRIIDSFNIVWFCFLLYLLNSLVGTSSDHLWFLACAIWAFCGALNTYIVNQSIRPGEGQVKFYGRRMTRLDGPITLACVFAAGFLLEAYFFWVWSDSLLLGIIANMFTVVGATCYLLYITWIWKNYLLYPSPENTVAENADS